MRHPSLHAVTWIFSRLVPQPDREPLIGDIAEEYALRKKTASSSAALRWYLRQICASTPHLLWLRLTRAAWLATLGVALLAYVAVGVLQVIIHWAMRSSSASLHDPLSLILIFPLVVLVAYAAERLRRRSAIVLGAMMLLAITAMTVFVTEEAPLWYRVSYFFVGPAAALIGGSWCSLRRRHRVTGI